MHGHQKFWRMILYGLTSGRSKHNFKGVTLLFCLGMIHRQLENLMESKADGPEICKVRQGGTRHRLFEHAGKLSIRRH